MSKQIKLFFIFMAFLAIVSIFSFFDVFGGVRSANFSDAPKPLPPLEDDADHDGLTDAEESYWNTDFQNQDTDNDGYLDGEEVAAGHDPRVPSSEGDRLENTVFGKPPTIAEPDLASLNLTDKTLALITGAIGAGDLTRDASQKTKDSSINALSFSVIDSFNKIQDSISLPGIITVENSKKTQVEYLTSLAQIIKDDLLNFQSQPNFDSQLGNQLPYFSTKSEQFKLSLTKTAALQVPTNWVDIHKNILKILSRLSLSYQQIADYQTDPLKAIVALNEMGTLNLEIKSLLKSIQVQISSENIVLDDEFYGLLDLLYKD